MPSPAVRPALLAITFLATLAAPAALEADEGDKRELLKSAGKAVVREAADYSYRRWIRERVWRDEDESRYGLALDENWQAIADKSPELPLVILVHGFNSTPARNAAVMTPIRKAGFPCGSFAYPNDWEIRESSALLSQQLANLAKDHPTQRIALVTHSMGGLVARASIENPQLDPGNVQQLIMIAPPTHGTLLAHLAVATDVSEHWLGRPEGGYWTRCRDSVVDGLGEAADDLVPGSPFLTRLNAYPRNPNVEYSLFLGTGAAVSEGEVKWIRLALQKTSGRSPGFRNYTDRFDGLLADMEEIVDGKGDGVVALKRGRLDGVDDVVILPFDHLSCTGAPDSDVVRQVQDELLARLR